MNRNLESLRKGALKNSKAVQDKEEKIALKLRDISDEDLRKELKRRKKVNVCAKYLEDKAKEKKEEAKEEASNFQGYCIMKVYLIVRI